MKRLILAGVLAMAALLATENRAEAIGWGPNGISFSFGIRYSFWYDYQKGGHGHPCLGPACYAQPFMGGAAPYLADHPWAHTGPFGHAGGYGGHWGGGFGAGYHYGYGWGY